MIFFISKSFKKAICNITVKEVNVTGISLQKSSITIKVGKTETLKIKEIKPSNATNKKVSWNSENDKIATVDKNGKIKGIAVGTTNVVVKTHNGKKAKCKVKVEKASSSTPTTPEKPVTPTDKVKVTGVKLNITKPCRFLEIHFSLFKGENHYDL